MLAYGTYHRNEATRQTKEVAERQEASQEVWGRTPRNGHMPTVQAYRPLAIKQDRRVEFSTDTKPGSESPYEAWWYLENDGVQRRDEGGEVFACIAVEISLNTQV